MDRTPKERAVAARGDGVMRDIADYRVEKFVNIRRDLHAHPELAFEELRTSELVASELAGYGYIVTSNIGRTGVVGTLCRGTSRRAIGLRADMDALPMEEKTGARYASRHAGKMHACGHDGHVAMLLCAARQLAKRDDLDGTVQLIFQPAEEEFGGAKEMIEEGLFERFDCDAVFGMHNFPGIPLGHIAYRFGAMMAAIDTCHVKINGTGGHGGLPHLAIDPVVVASSIVMALQTIVSRNVDPVGDGAVISVGRIHAGACSNVIPDSAELDVSIRSFCPDVRQYLKHRVIKLVESQADGYGATAEISYEPGYAATINSQAETAFVRDVALQEFGKSRTQEIRQPIAASEDFSEMLAVRPGCYFGIGIGDEPDRPFLHDPRYDFNDDCLAHGAAMWSSLATSYLRLQ